MQKLFFIVLFCTICFRGITQNRPILYDFAEIPQTQLLNPALDYNNKKHIGIPFLSGMHAEIGFKNFSLIDFFGANSTSFNQKLLNIEDKLSPRDFLTINSQLEIINIGFRLKEKNYLSFGLYQETDMILYFPKDPLSAYLEGNTINRLYNASHLNFQLDVLNVFHIGLSRKINNTINLGIRFKLYASIIQAQSKNNTGTFVTRQGVNNLLVNRVNDVNINVESSGIPIAEDSENFLLGENLANNLGVGLDFGITNQISPQLKISASILDFGFISHTKKVQSYTVNGAYTFEGIETFFSPENTSRTWESIRLELEQQLPVAENTTSYISIRPIKVNAALKYGFGKYKSRLCYDYTYKNEYANAVGAQFFSVFRPRGPQLALTGFYERMITRNFKTKFTYTLDSYSFSNIGIGASTKIGKVNFYGTIGNLIQFADISKSNNLVAQMGINYIVD